MIKGMEDERLVISQLVRIAVLQITMTASWSLLQSPGISDAQLAEVERDWSELELNQAPENALAMERAMAQKAQEKMHNSSAEFKRYATSFGMSGGTSSGDWFERAAQSTYLTANEAAWRFSWSDSDELLALQEAQIVIEAIRKARSNGAFGQGLSEKARRLTEARQRAGRRELNTDEDGSFHPWNLNVRSLFSDAASSVARVPDRLMRAEVSRQMVVAAIALKRFELLHGRYPADLVALTPQFVSTPPRDPVDGQPLRYRLKPDGSFLLYSVGEDGEDNGGDPTPAKKSSSSTFSWQRGRDWVWPQRATPSEAAESYRTNAASHHRP